MMMFNHINIKLQMCFLIAELQYSESSIIFHFRIFSMKILILNLQ